MYIYIYIDIDIDIYIYTYKLFNKIYRISISISIPKLSIHHICYNNY